MKGCKQITACVIWLIPILILMLCLMITANAAGSSLKVNSNLNLDASLRDLCRIYEAEGSQAASEFCHARNLDLTLNGVKVELTFRAGFRPANIPDLIFERCGAKVVSRSRSCLILSVPITRLQCLSEDLRPFARLHQPRRINQDVVSQGVTVAGADTFHTFGLHGFGARAAVIDLSFHGWQAAVEAEELPAEPELVNFTEHEMDEGNVHGTLCAEIIHDMAPLAEITLIQIEDTPGFENALQYCLDNGIQIVSVSLGWLGSNGDYYRGNDLVSQLVNEASEAGLFISQSAGNYANGNRMRSIFPARENGDYYRWSNGEIYSLIYGFGAQFAEGVTFFLSLSWDDFPESDQNLDLELWHLVDEDEWVMVAESNIEQDGDDLPEETIEFVVEDPGRYSVRILAVEIDTDVDFTLICNYNIADYTVEGSIGIPGLAEGAFTVGAKRYQHWNDPNRGVWFYSSRGPTYDGRLKPDITGMDYVTLFSQERAFLGTSAAAPHVAGTAALLISYNSELTTDELKDLIREQALDILEEGPDNVSGFGELHIRGLMDHPGGSLISIPNDMPSIGSAAMVAEQHDTILVEPGTYGGSHSFGGKDLLLTSRYLYDNDPQFIATTILDGFQRSSVFCAERGETVDAELRGLTLRNGRAYLGGGLFIFESEPTVRNCLITGNSAQWGGGVYVQSASPMFLDCSIEDNHAIETGGGVFMDRSRARFERINFSRNESADVGGGITAVNSSYLTFTNCVITGNQAANSGGGAEMLRASHCSFMKCLIVSNTVLSNTGTGGAIFTDRSLQSIDFCTFSDNDARLGAAIYCANGGGAILGSSIVWGEWELPVYLANDGTPTTIHISYSDIEGGEEAIIRERGSSLDWGDGNIDADPLFAAVEEGDYRLTWTDYPMGDEYKSPCIDAGDPDEPLDPDSTLPDMGSFYFDHDPLHAPYVSDAAAFDDFRLVSFGPNPFNGKLSIVWEQPVSGAVDLTIWDLTGRLVRERDLGNQKWGRHHISQSFDGLPSGLYWIRLESEGRAFLVKGLFVQ